MLRIDHGQELVAQILHNEPVVAAERFDEGAGVGHPFQGESGEDQARGPAFGPIT